MPINILMPALSPTMTEGNLARWHKKEGDTVNAGDVIAEIETDKATMEVEAADSGVLGRIVVPEGTQNVKVNAVIGMLLAEGEDAKAAAAEPKAEAPKPTAPKAEPAPAPQPKADAPKPAAHAGNGGSAPAASPLARRIAAQSGIDLSGVSGSGSHGKIMRADVESAMTGGAAPARPADGDRLFASPLARRMAAQAGIDLATVDGSGPDGRIVKADVEAALSAPRQPAAAKPAAAPAAAPERPKAASAARPAPAPGERPEPQLVPLSAMRRVIAERMAHAKSTVPHFYETVDCEIDELMKVRAQLNERVKDNKISVNDFVVRACALALREVPEANVSFHDGQMLKYDTVDISVAVALDGGLITPIVFDADRKGLAQIAAETKDLATRARAMKLQPHEYQGGTFSISNLGMFGIKQFDAVINEPQAGILAVGAGEQRPVVKNGALAVATVMTITLSCDHRVVDGAIGARLLVAIKRLIEYPPAMLL
ncbi:MAG: 2-oxo acid dehydrogenase subunit E2 [Rhodospirillales bacterium]